MTMMPNVDPQLLRMISSTMGPQEISDEVATSRFGVGPAGDNRIWVLRKAGKELALFDKSKGLWQMVYRKSVSERPVEPTVQQVSDAPSGDTPPIVATSTKEAIAPRSRPLVPISFSDSTDAVALDRSGDLDFGLGDLPLPPSMLPPPSPIKATKKSGPRIQTGGVDAIGDEPGDQYAPLHLKGSKARWREHLEKRKREKGPLAPARFEGTSSVDAADPSMSFMPASSSSDSLAETPLPLLPTSKSTGPQIQLPTDKTPRKPKILEKPLELSSEAMPRPVYDRLAAASDSLRQLIDLTVEDTGGFAPPKDQVIISSDAIEQVSNGAEAVAYPPSERAYTMKPSTDTEIIIDPNTNTARILRAGKEIRKFSVGTGDITGTRYGKPYYTPVGVWEIDQKVAYGDVDGSYGPWWLRFTAPKSASGGGYGLHGPYNIADLGPTQQDFVNAGYVSHGCVRFTEADALELGRLLDIGARVTILPYIGKRVSLTIAPEVEALP